MHLSENGLDFIKKEEGFCRSVYLDSAGLKTIGYGHLIKAGESFTLISEHEAEIILEKDVMDASSLVNRMVLTPLTQNQFDALVSFVFNVGAGRSGFKDGFATLKSGGQSTMLRKLNMADYEGAAEEFQKWVKAGGNVIKGLVNRRNREKALFLKE